MPRGTSSATLLHVGRRQPIIKGLIKVGEGWGRTDLTKFVPWILPPRAPEISSPSIHPCIHPSVHPSVHPSIHPSIHPVLSRTNLRSERATSGAHGMYTYPWRVSHSYFCIESSHFRQRDYVNMQTLSRVREKFSGAREAIVVTIYPVFSSQPWSQVELPTKLKLNNNMEKSRWPEGAAPPAD
ncbi:hypothetical protein GEV33_006949 [Tenebrio molitor]|uniref:Uncharacterized protein n=1 Tax=Tenebrio molitor TaxID=7067 RepID=A0A8J6LCR7_TENMO|nr:hypothetical protein GEV33_006949 [Tenebrio molitor]